MLFGKIPGGNGYKNAGWQWQKTNNGLVKTKFPEKVTFFTRVEARGAGCIISLAKLVNRILNR